MEFIFILLLWSWLIQMGMNHPINTNRNQPSPSHHHVFYRWYGYHSQSWVVKMALFNPPKSCRHPGWRTIQGVERSLVSMYMTWAPWRPLDGYGRLMLNSWRLIPRDLITGIKGWKKTGWWFGTWILWLSIYWEPSSQLTRIYPLVMTNIAMV